MARSTWIPIVFLTAVIGCVPSAPPPALDSQIPGIEQDFSSQIDLKRIEPQLLFGTSEVSVAPAADEVPLTGWERSSTVGNRSVWTTALPFELPSDVPPPSMRLIVDGEVISWSRKGQKSSGWRIRNGSSIELFRDVRPVRAHLVAPSVAAEARRLDPWQAGLPITEYATYRHTRNGSSSAGYLFPAYSDATWTVRIPARGIFRAKVRSLRDDGGETPIGLEVKVRVTENGASFVKSVGTLFPGEQSQTIDLSAWSGQTVLLTVQRRDRRASVVFLENPWIVSPQVADPIRVVWVGLDTTRRDRLGTYGYSRPTTPNLDALAQRGWTFTNAVTPAPRTRPSFRSALTGRRPLDAVGATTWLERLADNGFATAGIVSNIHLNPRFDFDEGVDQWLLEPTNSAAAQVDSAVAWLKEHRTENSALFLHLMDPHLPYLPGPEARERFVDPNSPKFGRFNREKVLQWMEQSDWSDAKAKAISDLYDAEVWQMDQAVGRLLAAMDALPGRSIVIVHSDHGEELWDHGGFEHNHALTPELHDAVMMVVGPGISPARRSDPATLMDLAPTLYELLGLPPDPDLEGQSLVSEMPDSRSLDIGHLMYDVEQWGVRQNTGTYLVETASGNERWFDRSVDTKEQNNAFDTLDDAQRADLRAALGSAHGMFVGQGWRVQFSNLKREVELRLPVRPVQVALLDPESARTDRANLAWGGRPAVDPKSWSAVAWEEESSVLRITPGAHAEGIVAIAFDNAQAVEGSVWIDGDAWELDNVVDTPFVQLRVQPGTVVFPPKGEAARMNGEAAPSDDVRALLERLGYIAPGGDAH